MDSEIKEIYVGSTKNPKNRERDHKWRCHNENNCKVYQFIRANGGWENWKMEIFEYFDVEDETEQYIIEQSFISAIEPELNNKRAYRTEEEHKEQHIECDKEYYDKNKEKIAIRNAQKTICECGSSYRHSDKARHKRSGKHKTYLITP